MEFTLNTNAAGWVNPYRYDGRDRVLADPADGLDWLATRVAKHRGVLRFTSLPSLPLKARRVL